MAAAKTSVRQRLGERLAQVDGPFPGKTSAESATTYEEIGEEARRFLGEHARTYVAAILEACVRMKHRGSVPPRDGRSGLPCLRCQGRVKAMNEVVELIEPDRG